MCRRAGERTGQVCERSSLFKYVHLVVVERQARIPCEVSAFGISQPDFLSEQAYEDAK